MTSYLRKILITGGNGQLGQALKNHPQAHRFSIKTCSHHECDITDLASVKNTLVEFKPSIVINTAAFTAVDKAEQETNTAKLTNDTGTKNLATVCRNYQIPLIHVSTDYIFDGSKMQSYQEEDEANPINFYGLSKWLGEEAVRETCDQHIILRVSGVFSEYGHNFFKTILRLAQEKKEMRVVSDQFTCPTYAGDIASAIFRLANNPERWGTYHFSSAIPVSWYQFAVAIIHEAKQRTDFSYAEIQPITTADYPTAAKRPRYSVLDCRKITETFGINQPSWELGITKAYQGILVNG